MNDDSVSFNWPGFLRSNSAAAIFTLGVGFGVGVTQGAKSVSFFRAPYSTGKVLILSKYERLEPKMTLTDVRAILGDGIEVSHSVASLKTNAVVTTKHEWRNSDGSKITATFQNDLLLEKDLISR